jgi:hypothetical protein
MGCEYQLCSFWELFLRDRIRVRKVIQAIRSRPPARMSAAATAL